MVGETQEKWDTILGLQSQVNSFFHHRSTRGMFTTSKGGIFYQFYVRKVFISLDKS